MTPVMNIEEYFNIGFSLWNLIFKETSVLIWLLALIFSTFITTVMVAYSGLKDEEAEIIISLLLIGSIAFSFWFFPNVAFKYLIFVIPVTVGLTSVSFLAFRWAVDKPTNQEFVKMSIGFVCFLVTLSGVVFPLISIIWYTLLIVAWGVYTLIIIKTIFDER